MFDRDYELKMKEKLSQIWVDCIHCDQKYNLLTPCIHHKVNSYDDKFKKV